MRQLDDARMTPRTERKRQAILSAARERFLETGYADTSMDAVASAAGVSKQTIYKQFADKERLFAAVLTADIEQAEGRTSTLVAGLADADDVTAALHTFARQHIIEVLQPHLLRWRRVVIAEADRFPELARTWYETGPAKAHATLADQFSLLADRGLLRVPDPQLAAAQFNWLVLSIPLNEAMFGLALPSRSRLRRYADEAVGVFLAAYGAGAR